MLRQQGSQFTGFLDFLEPKSAAFNLIDAVRAARTVVPQLSSRWVALGSSQGGETAWATA